jgi:hypothetical protein
MTGQKRNKAEIRPKYYSLAFYVSLMTYTSARHLDWLRGPTPTLSIIMKH